MPTHHATFINNKPKNEFNKGDQRIIKTELIEQAKVKVTILHAAPPPHPIIYDSEADFYKDWHIDRTDSANPDEVQDLIKHLKTKE